MDSTPNLTVNSTASIATKLAAIRLVSKEGDRFLDKYEKKHAEGLELQSKRSSEDFKSLSFWENEAAQTCFDAATRYKIQYMTLKRTQQILEEQL